MVNYIYDGSFPGLLTAIYEACNRREKPRGITASGTFQESIFDTGIFIPADDKKARAVLKAVQQRISHDALKNISYVFLSETEDAATVIYNYLELGWKVGSRISLHLSDDRVFKVQDISRKVLGERHRMLGLIRFRHLKGDVYYAPMEPDFNITGLVAPHFAERMACQNWIIHDVGRDLAALYNTRNWVTADFSLDGEPFLAADEAQYQDLWKTYHRSISITNRANPRLQRRNMPSRYWKYLLEKDS